MKPVLITTTGSIEGQNIHRYLGLISAHTVAGTGLFSDIAAGFSDLFGGRSGAYQKQLERLNAAVLEELSEKARRMGANAVLGVRIDYDEISGKNVQMFMVTATGTAVQLADKPTASASSAFSQEGRVMSRDELEQAFEIEQILDVLQEGDDIPVETLEVLAKLAAPGAALSLSRWLRQTYPSGNPIHRNSPVLSAIKAFFERTTDSAAEEALYEILEDPGASSTLYGHAAKWLAERGLVDYVRIVKGLAAGGVRSRRHWVWLAAALPAYVTSQDAHRANDLRKQIEELSVLAERTEKKGFMGSTVRRWKCAFCAEENEDTSEVCYKCGVDERAVVPSEAAEALDMLDAVGRHLANPPAA